MSTGIFTTATITEDMARLSFAANIARLMPMGSAPLFGLTGLLTAETAVQQEHFFYTKSALFASMKLTANAGAGDTVLNVESTANIIPNGVYQVTPSSGGGVTENVLVNVVLSPTQVSVVRGFGNVAPAAINANVVLYKIGSAFEESSLRPNAQAINPVRISNFTQIFRDTWAVSDSARATLVIAGEGNVQESKTDCAAFHAQSIESSLFFGQRSVSSRNGQPIRTMDGHISIVANPASYPAIYGGIANITTAGGTTNATQFETMLDPVFNQTTDPKGANERVLFVGGTAKRVINDIARKNGTYFLQGGATQWGLQFDTYKIARGSFRIIEHPLFNSNPFWSKMAVTVDLATFNVAYLGDRKTQSKSFNEDGKTAQDNGIDAVGGTLTTELTCIIKNPPANAVIYNLTSGVAG